MRTMRVLMDIGALRKRLFFCTIDILCKQFYKSVVSFIRVLDLDGRDSDQETVLVMAAVSKPTRRRRGNWNIGFEPESVRWVSFGKLSEARGD